MSMWELSKEHYNWESPLTKIYGDMHNKIIRQDEENCTFVIEQAFGYKVDKDELLKALQYDRNQYDKGYNDGRKEIFVTALEKIKEEIKEFAYLFDDLSPDKTLVVDLDNIEEVIDKHISELKGDNE